MIQLSEAADLFERLALHECVIFEDCDFAAISNEIIYAALPTELPCGQIFALPSVDKRLLITPELLSTDRALTRVQDILCVRLSRLPHNRGRIRLLQRMLNDTDINKPRICFLLRYSRNEASYIADLLHHPLRIEWITPYSDGNFRSSLVLDRAWLPESLDHAAKVISRYRSTLKAEKI